MKIKMLNTVFYQGAKYPMGAVVDVDEKVAFAVGKESCEIIAPPIVSVPQQPQVEAPQVEEKPKRRMYKRKNKMLTGEEIKNK